MIWMRDSDRAYDSALGSPPPPLRPLFPRDSNFVTWVHSRIRIYHNGTLYSDTGWSDYTPLATFYGVPSSVTASKSSTVDVTTTLDIEVGGSRMPWQIVFEEIDSHTGGSVTTLTTHDITPGTVATINWSAALNHTIVTNRAMVKIPAEGA
jgi:hypothetical protein